MTIALVISQFAEKSGTTLTELERTCVARLTELGAQHEIFRVPGAFEIPTAVKKVLLTKKFAAVIALGVVVRGETLHFELVAKNCTRKLADLGVEFGEPVICGVLATDTTVQAEARGQLGKSFAETAVRMIGTLTEIG